MDFTPPPLPPPPPADDGPVHTVVVSAHAEQISEHAARQPSSPHADPCDTSHVEVGGPSATGIALPYRFQPEARPDVTTSSS